MKEILNDPRVKGLCDLLGSIDKTKQTEENLKSLNTKVEEQFCNLKGQMYNLEKTLTTRIDEIEQSLIEFSKKERDSKKWSRISRPALPKSLTSPRIGAQNWKPTQFEADHPNALFLTAASYRLLREDLFKEMKNLSSAHFNIFPFICWPIFIDFLVKPYVIKKWGTLEIYIKDSTGTPCKATYNHLLYDVPLKIFAVRSPFNWARRRVVITPRRKKEMNDVFSHFSQYHAYDRPRNSVNIHYNKVSPDAKGLNAKGVLDNIKKQYKYYSTNQHTK